MKNKFNWNRFYNELESADPKNFPYHLWFVNEIQNLIGNIVSGFLMAIFFVILIISFMGVIFKYIENHPEWSANQFCYSYQNANK